MMKKIPNIKETKQELKKLISKQNDFNRRQKLKVLYLVANGKAKTRINIAEELEVNRDTVGRWLNTYEQGGIEQLMIIKKAGRKKGQRVLPQDVYTSLQDKLNDKSGFKDYQEIINWIKEKHDLEVKYKSIHRIVYYELGAKPKVPRPSNIKKA